MPQEEKDAQLKRKLNNGCVADFLAWLSNSHEDMPNSFLSHGPENQVEIMFGAIEKNRELSISNSTTLLV